MIIFKQWIHLAIMKNYTYYCPIRLSPDLLVTIEANFNSDVLIIWGILNRHLGSRSSKIKITPRNWRRKHCRLRRALIECHTQNMWFYCGLLGLYKDLL